MSPKFKWRAVRLGLLLLGHALVIVAVFLASIVVGADRFGEMSLYVVLSSQCGLLNLWALTSRHPFLATPFALAGGSLLAAWINLIWKRIIYPWIEWDWHNFEALVHLLAEPGIIVILSLMIYRLLLRKSAWFRRGAKEAARMRFGLRFPLAAIGLIAVVLAVPHWLPAAPTWGPEPVRTSLFGPVVSVVLVTPVLAAYLAFVTKAYQKRSLVIALVVSAGVGMLPWYYFGEMLPGISAYIWLTPAICLLTFIGLKTAHWLCGKSFRLLAFPPSP